jgi:DNA invertase Pin-like site-specific DNA recombinase
MAKTRAVEATKRAVVYARISEDPMGAAAGVARQEADSRAFCDARGWPIVDVLVDNDITASRYGRKRRPGWARVLELVDSGAVDAIVAWDLDRMLRQPRELEDLIDRAERGLTVLTLQGQLDLSTADGRAMARVMVAMAAKASDDTSRRVKRAKLAKAQRGEVFTAVRAFGWTDNGHTIVPDEAAAIRDAATRVLAGEGITAIAREWTAKGYRRPRGGTAWSATTVRAVLSSPRNAALVQYQGEVLGPAAWPAIIDRATFAALRRLFADPGRKVSPRRRGTFTGVFRCGRCGGKLCRDATSGKTVWRCKPSPGIARCGRVAITGRLVEPVIVEALMLAADTGKLAELVAGRHREHLDPQLVAELDVIAARMTELAEMFAAGDIGRGEWLAARKPLESKQAALEASLAAGRRASALDAYVGAPGALRKMWEADTTSDDLRRAVLHAVFEAVVVHPKGPAHEAITDRLDLVWRG